MILEIFIIIIFLILVYAFLTYYFNWKNLWMNKLFTKFASSEASDLREDSLNLISTGSAMGIGIGLTVSAWLGTNLFIGLVFIGIGLYSAKKNWYLVRQ